MVRGDDPARWGGDERDGMVVRSMGRSRDRRKGGHGGRFGRIIGILIEPRGIWSRMMGNLYGDMERQAVT